LNRPAAVLPLVPPDVCTVTNTVSLPGGEVAVHELAEQVTFVAGLAACCTVRMGLAVPIRSLVAETEAPEATGTKPVVVQRCRSVLGRTASGSGSPRRARAVTMGRKKPQVTTPACIGP
jgi:hypothetical protein